MIVHSSLLAACHDIAHTGCRVTCRLWQLNLMDHMAILTLLLVWIFEFVYLGNIPVLFFGGSGVEFRGDTFHSMAQAQVSLIDHLTTMLFIVNCYSLNRVIPSVIYLSVFDNCLWNNSWSDAISFDVPCCNICVHCRFAVCSNLGRLFSGWLCSRLYSRWVAVAHGCTTSILPSAFRSDGYVCW